MDDALILETTFLIDLEREATRGASGAAQDLLARHPKHRLYITPTVAGELAAGASTSQRARWEAFIAPFHVLPLDREVCWQYGNAFRYLQANGLLIGAKTYGSPLSASRTRFRSSAGTRGTSSECPG